MTQFNYEFYTCNHHNHCKNCGIETIVFGPGGMTEMHQPDEFISCAAIAEGLQFLTALHGYMVSDQ